MTKHDGDAGVHWAVWFVIVVGVGVNFGSLGVSWALSAPGDRALNTLVWMLSVSCGFLLGALFSPIGKEEKLEFGAAASALSMFVTGFVFGKLDRLIERAIDQQVTAAEVFTLPVVLFASTLLTTVGLTAAIRRYALPSPEAARKASEEPRAADSSA